MPRAIVRPYYALCVWVACSVASASVFVLPADSLDRYDLIDGFRGVFRDTRKERMYNPVLGYVVNSSNHFYYTGDTAALNQFLSRVKGLVDAPRNEHGYGKISAKVVIHSGVNYAKRPTSKDSEHPIRANWKCESLKEIDPVDFEMNALRNLSLVIHVWVDDRIRLDLLEVPAGFAVESGGEIEQFVKKIRSRP